MAALLAVTSVSYIGSTVLARDFDAEIRAKEREAAQYQAEANRLASQADSLNRELGILNNQINQIQAEIAASQQKHDKLVEDIEKSKKQIERNREALGEILSDMYVDDKISPLEMLASSNSIGDYIDKQEQRSTLRQGLNEKIKEIKELQKKLEKSRDEVKKVLDEQRFKQSELASKQSTQKNLLDRTKGDEAAYQNLVKDRQSQIDGLRRQQQELIRLRSQGAGGGTYITVGGSGGYPWSGVSYPCWSGACADPWGLYYRECVSYVAWKLSVNGRGVKHFSGLGHAYQWPSTTSGYTNQSRSPSVGSALVFPAGVQGAAWTGHVMYVEQVNAGGTIIVSEYNWDGMGSYSERELKSHEYSGGTFISFPAR